MSDYSHKYVNIVSKIDISEAGCVYPDEVGLYVYKCEESDGQWAFAAICSLNNKLVVREEALGSTDLIAFCEGLTDLYWYQVA